jgi:dihydropteroate synthase
MISKKPLPTAPAPTAIELDALDCATARSLRLRPLGILNGSAAIAAMASGAALSLAGGDSAFPLVEVLARTPERIVAALASLRRLRVWASAQGEHQRHRIETQLSRLSAKREAWAGLTFDAPLVMGIVNVTPDSFYTGTGDDSQKAIALGRAMLEAGARILDIGGESTRPGAAPVSAEDEIRRLEPVVRALANLGAVISVDTRKASVMQAAMSWGTRIINDVSALADRGSVDVIARTGAAVVLMHMRGEPGTMQQAPSYDLASLEIGDYLAERITACEEAGVPLHRIVVDPGIGFGKAVEHNLEILGRLSLLHGLGCGVLVGLSRKSTIGRVSGGAPVEARLPGSIAGALYALGQGAQILRVHDVAETCQAIAMWQAMAGGA